MQAITAFVMAGGKSSRMGRDKAFLEFDGQTMLDRLLNITRGVTKEICIVGDLAKFRSFGSVVEDIFRDRGPLGGIHAALSSTKTDLNLMVAVDLPFIEAK